VKNIRLKYFITLSTLLINFCLDAQNDDAVITIVGNPLEADNNIGNNFNTALQSNQPPPPVYQQLAPTDQNIEPTLENGFHMRFQLENPASVERVTNLGSPSAGYSGSSSGGGAKARKRTITMSERSFNFKKKLKNWMPKRKKKYHPTLCEKFR
jgi:hypothetical protein